MIAPSNQEATVRGGGEGFHAEHAGEPYFIGLNSRAMVSLGTLASVGYCTYSCKFCYVQGPFPRYPRRTARDVVEWLQQQDDAGRSFDVVYVSGDTDSFAAPRTAEALKLLELLGDYHRKIDVLFTTRYVFSEPERERLRGIVEKYEHSPRLLVPCISVSQVSYPELEPWPVPTASNRLEQVRWLHEIGAHVILTVRPFIPYIPASEYVEIVRRNESACSAVLGGDWYVDPDGLLDDLTRTALEPRLGRLAPLKPSGPPSFLDFSSDDSKWFTYSHPEAAEAVEAECDRSGLRFFMRSTPALQALHERSTIA